MENRGYSIYEVGSSGGNDWGEWNLFHSFVPGINIELEHGLVNPNTNVTNNDLEMTAKIAIAHLNEFPNYYNKEYGLPAFEKMLASKSQSNQEIRCFPSWKNE